MTRPHANRRASLPSREPATRPNRDVWICLLLAAAVFAIYAQTAGHAFLNYDDPDYVTANVHVRAGLTASGLAWAFSSIEASNWFPLTWISHMLDCQIFGLHSGPQHLVNVALHATSVVLLFLFLKRTTRATGPSAFVAAVFALHPLHVESVAWIAERKDVLFALFWMAAMLAYAWNAEQSSLGRYAVVTTLFVCGLMSKPMMVTFPFAMLLVDIWPLRRFGSQPARRVILEKIPLVALSLGASMIDWVAQRRGGSVAAADQIPLGFRLGNALVSYLVYLRDFVWPAKLAVFYPYSLDRPGWWAIAAGIVIGGISLLAVRRLRQRPYISAGWFWYLGTLIPVIGLVQAGSQSRADRYTYIPLIGVSIVLAWGAVELFDERGWNRRMLAGAGVMACAVWGGISAIQVGYWRDSVTLFSHALQVTDGNYVAYNNRGAALRHDGRIAESIEDFQHAAALRPEDPETQDNLGEALTASGRVEDAAPHLEQAVRLRPAFAKARVDYGAALVQTGRAAEAESQYRAAVAIHSEDAAAQYGLGGVLMTEGRQQEALAHLQLALRLLADWVAADPDDADGRYNLGTLYGILGRTDEAIVQFSETIRLRPGDAQARFNLGTALALRNRVPEASEQFAAAVQLVPEYAAAHFHLARTLTALGRYEQAIQEYRETLRLNPEYPEARRELENARARAAK